MRMLLLVILMLSSVSGELIDLSYPYDENTPYWVTEIPFRFIKKEANSDKGYWYASNQFETAEHCGSHLDAPYHFNKLGWKLNEIPLSRLITTGVFLNASSETNGNCSFKLTSKELQKWECEHGPFPNNSILLVSFGWASRFIKKEANSDKGYWYASNQFETAEHCGSHLDAPYHFNKLGWKLNEIPLSRLITTGVFLNASSETNGNCSFKLTSKELQKWECEHGPFPNNSILLVSFGWASRYNNKTEYFGPTDKLCFPGLSKEAAEWITKSEKIVGVGVDTPSIDQGSNVESHIELTSKNVFMLENVALNPFIPLPSKFNISALPIKIKNGTGGPCRIVAVT